MWRKYRTGILAFVAIAAIAAAGSYARGRPLDLQAFRAINTGCPNAAFDALGSLGYVLGSFWFALALVLALFLLGHQRLALSSLGAIVAAALLVLLIKLVAGEPRPAQMLPDVRLARVPEFGLGFPSAHASQGFLTAYLLASYFSPRRPARAGLYGLAALVALSRVYEGVHFPSDVVAGSLIGLSFGVLWVRSPLWPRARAQGRP